MELFSHREVCRIVEFYITEFAKWTGCNPEKANAIAKLFLEENPKAMFRREIKVEEIDVKDLDVDSTI